MNIDLTQIALLIISLIGTILTTFVVPWLKSKIDINNGVVTENQVAMFKLAIDTAVKAAEQLFNSEEGQKKKSYVLSILQSQGYEIDGSAIDAAIEASVLELHRQLTE